MTPLLHPALLAEVQIFIRPDGSYQLSVSKFPPQDGAPLHVVKAVIGAGFDLARVYGIQVTRAEVAAPPAPPRPDPPAPAPPDPAGSP